MAGLTWILTFICVAEGHLTSASPVLQSAPVVEAGQNVSLTCNVTSVTDVTWYLLRSDQLLPLLTVQPSKIGEDTVIFYTTDNSRIYKVGALESGTVGLQILKVEEEDAGLYFCIGRCAGVVCHKKRFQLAVNGVHGESARQPCFSLGICVLPALLVLCVVVIVGCYLCSGKPAVCCCCSSAQGNMSLKATEDESLHYSSLKHTDKPRPSGRGRTTLVEDSVTYSTVKNLKASLNRS